jgi:FMN phosphatase YigB (HAD superfamily)
MATELRALLVDLDDTLFDNAMDTFVPAYFDAIARWAADWVPRERLIAELLRGTRAMQASDGTGPTNAEVFAASFYPAVGHPREVLEPVFDRFYREAFPALAALTRPRPAARDLLDWAFAAGLRVAVTTNPLFPAVAVEQRLAWAGVPVTEYDYALVTTYEVMHATKSHPAYYHEVLARLDLPAGACVVAGDDWEWDVVCAAEAGLRAFWVAPDGAEPPTPEPQPVGRGDLGALLDWLRSAV